MSTRKKLEIVDNPIAAEMGICIDMHILKPFISTLTVQSPRCGIQQKSRKWWN
jgi:hypothetical protein